MRKGVALQTSTIWLWFLHLVIVVAKTGGLVQYVSRQSLCIAQQIQ